MTAPLPVAVLDYGAGNLRSVVRALEVAGARPFLATTPQEARSAPALVLPGQGASGQAMEGLRAAGLETALRQALAQGVPYLGVCLGLQLLMDWSEEGGVACLGVLRGRVRRLPPGLKVPHMGWNRVCWVGEHPALEGVPQDAYFYFVHSYYADPEDPSIVAGWTEYGVRFCSAVARGNVVAVQFHPEKSGEVGLRLYRNFVRWAGKEAG